MRRNRSAQRPGGRDRWRAGGLLLAWATAFGLLLVSAAPAGAQTPGETSGATGIVATGPLVTIPPTPNASCGTPQNLSLAAAGSGSVTASVLNARCSGTTSQASVVQANVVGMKITAVSSTCTDGATSSSLATINGQTIATQNFHLTVGTATVTVNETTTNSSGELVRNAVHVTASGEDVIIAQARCRAPQAIVSESHLALLLPLSAAALFGGAILFVRRRGSTPPAS
jgi:hypothetical protein